MHMRNSIASNHVLSSYCEEFFSGMKVYCQYGAVVSALIGSEESRHNLFIAFKYQHSFFSHMTPNDESELKFTLIQKEPDGCFKRRIVIAILKQRKYKRNIKITRLWMKRSVDNQF